MSNNNHSGGDALLKLFIFVAFLLFLCFRGCMASPDDAKHHLEALGFSDVTIHSHHWMLVGFRGCGADAAVFKTSAKNIKGEVVKLNVCTGWPFKGTTVRGR